MSAAQVAKRGRRPAGRDGSSGYLLLPVALVIAVVAAVAFLMNRESALDIRSAGSIFEADAARYIAEAGLRHALWQANAGACSGYGVPAAALGAHSYQAVFAPDGGSPVSVTATGTLASGASRSLRRDGVKIHQIPSVTTLQPDAVAGKDAFLDEFHPTWNHGAHGDLAVEGFTGSAIHALIRFDLGDLPPAARVTGAFLELYQKAPDANGGTINVHRLTRDWTEGIGTGSSGTGATWNESEPGSAWTTPGGDFDPAVVAAAAIPASTTGWFRWDITALVQGWHGLDYPNHGLALKAATTTTTGYFASSDETGTTRQPKLIVSYACECGKACPPPPPVCDADFTPDTKVSEFSTAGQSYRYNRGITYVPEGWTLAGSAVPAGGMWVTVGESGRLVALDMAGTVLDDSFDTGLSGFQGIAFVPEGAKAGQFALVDVDTLYYVDLDLPPAGSYTTHALPYLDSGGGITYVDGGAYNGHLAVADSGLGQIHIIDQSLNLIATLATDAVLDAPEGIVHLRDTDKFLVADKNLNAAIVVDVDLNVSQSYNLNPFGWGEPAAAALRPGSCDHVISNHSNDLYASLNVVPSGTVDVRIASSSDDAEELLATNNVDLIGTDLEIVEDLGFAQLVGLRFSGINVPNGVTIANAWLQFKTDEKSTGNTNLTIRGEAVDDAVTFADASANVSSRVLTTASMSWSPSTWTSVGEAGPKQRTPDLSAVIQEIVDRPGWASGNALVVVISGAGTRTAESFEGDSTGAPLLHIEY